MDGVPVNVIKRCKEQLARPLTYLINNSLELGEFPEQLKQALVKPLFKKGCEDAPESYRPISLLPSFSKIFELVVSKQLMAFLIDQDILFPSQHGFIKGKSTQTAIYEFIKKTLGAQEGSEIAMAVFLDLSKAFDTLNHEQILQKMNSYGIRDIPLKWFRSYLSSRTQQVLITNEETQAVSDPLPVQLGVPQGSILGPLIFIIFINDLFAETASITDCSLINYADDTNILLKATTLDALKCLIESTITKVNEWFLKNQLCLNTQKTSAVMFHTNHANVEIPQYIETVDNKLPLERNCNFLCLTIDESLNWRDNVTNLCGKLSSTCYSLGVLSRYLDSTSMKTIYQAVFESKMRYGIIFYGASSGMEEILKLQKRAIRIIYRLEFRESCRGKFHENNLLTAFAIYIQECLLFVYKNRDYFEGKTITKYNTRTTELKYPKHRLTLTERNAEYCCTKFFNKLPPQIRAETTLNSFKRQIFQLLLKMEPYSLREFFEY